MYDKKVKDTGQDQSGTTDAADPAIYCKLGHLLLLTEQFEKGEYEAVPPQPKVFFYM